MAVGAPREVNLDEATRSALSSFASEVPAADLFDGARRRIFGQLENDAYGRFLAWGVCRAILGKEGAPRLNEPEGVIIVEETRL